MQIKLERLFKRLEENQDLRKELVTFCGEHQEFLQKIDNYLLERDNLLDEIFEEALKEPLPIDGELDLVCWLEKKLNMILFNRETTRVIEARLHHVKNGSEW